VDPLRDLVSMPKVELHLHLEGAIPLETMWSLVEAKGAPAGVSSIEELKRRFDFRGFSTFVELWIWKNRFLDSYDAFTVAAGAVAESLVADRIECAEMYFSPTDFSSYGLEVAELAMAIRRGLDTVRGAEVALVLELVRDTGALRAGRTFDKVREVAAEARVIGITIGGSEAEYPPHLFADVYKRVAADGFRLTAHAGEAAGPQSVWAALQTPSGSNA
jgi:adenosine deaminase